MVNWGALDDSAPRCVILCEKLTVSCTIHEYFLTDHLQCLRKIIFLLIVQLRRLESPETKLTFYLQQLECSTVIISLHSVDTASGISKLGISQDGQKHIFSISNFPGALLANKPVSISASSNANNRLATIAALTKKTASRMKQTQGVSVTKLSDFRTKD